LQRIRTEVNVREIQELFLGTSFLSRLSMDDQLLCYRILLDTDPPPIMAVTPPGPQTSPPIDSESFLSEYKREGKISRSRYRNANGPRSSSNGTSNQGHTKNAKSQWIDHLQDTRRLSHVSGKQSVNSAKPQLVPSATTDNQARKAMPDLMAVHDVAPTLRAGTQAIEMTKSSQQYYSISHVNHLPVCQPLTAKIRTSKAHSSITETTTSLRT